MRRMQSPILGYAQRMAKILGEGITMDKSNNIAKFGTAGVPVNFSKPPFKGKREQFFGWLKDNGLNAFELQCTYGYKNIGFTAEQIEKAKSDGIYVSIHGPYYINLGSQNLDVQANSKRILDDGIKFANTLGVSRFIFHPGGGYGKTSEDRVNGLMTVINNMKAVVMQNDMTNVSLYPEIGGKVSNLGSLDEIITICKSVPNTYPCIDVAHLHARENGSLNSVADFVRVFDRIENELGRDYLDKTHFHCYTIEYNEKGEIKHRVFNDSDCEFLDNFVLACKSKNMTPWVISEALNSQDESAKYIGKKYNG